jgi:hypothetical protein
MERAPVPTRQMAGWVTEPLDALNWKIFVVQRKRGHDCFTINNTRKPEQLRLYKGGFTHSMPCPCHAAPLLCSDSAVSFVKVRVVGENIRTASPTVSQIVFFFCSVLLPLFTVAGMDRCENWYASDINLRGTPRGSRKTPNAGRYPTGRLSTAVLCRGLAKDGMFRAWHGRGMASVNQTRPQCVNQMGKTHSKPSAARHGRGTAWARHAMCESALKARLIRY